MNETVRMVTAVPQKLAQQLTKSKRITNYNTLPQVDERVMECIRTELAEKVGYENSPIACLSKLNHIETSLKTAGTNISYYIPVKAEDSVIFELKMPKDCVISIEYKSLLEYSKRIKESDIFDEELILDDLKEELQLGLADELEDAISFIPFIELEKCQFFALLTSAFNTSRFDLEGVEKVDLRKLTSFV